MRMTLNPVTTVVLLALGLVSACQGPVVQSPLTGQTRYLCCNLHYERTKINDTNFQVGALVPFGTRIQIIEVRRSSVTFQPDGHPSVTLVYKHGAKTVPFEQYVEHLFVVQDPHAKLKKVPQKTVKLIEQGVVEPGMTREQVLMALGYPPAHQTPSLESPTWRYWKNRWVSYLVFFDGDKVARVQE